MSLAVPRLLRLDITKRWTKDPSIWAPQKLLAGDDSFFPPSYSLSVKRSAKSRFFMYEEHAGAKLDDEDGPTEVMQVSPSHFADILNRKKFENGYDKTKMEMADRKIQLHEKHHHHHHHYYCTFPIANVAPGLLTLLNGYEKLYDHVNHDNDHNKANVPQHHQPMIDPRGPSLWMGTNNSSTQAHYDVADNIICQLHGTKRVRCYSPKAASALHVFPDAHPRARKSQVNFDDPDLERFPYFSSLAPPDLDVVLKPGCALFIPAFWFHHVENGSEFESEDEFSSGSVISSGSIGVGRPGPSVSVNVFSLSRPMMIAQSIFRDASRPLRSLSPSSLSGPSFDFAAAVLHALSWKLMKDLNMADSDPRAFIQRHLLDTRYTPLLSTSIDEKNHNIGDADANADVDDGGDDFEDGCDDDGPLKRAKADLTVAEKEMISNCIARIIPQFESLREENNGENDCGGGGGDAGYSRDEDDGVVSLVLCHLFELWAVELVGASSVEEVWKAAILLAHD